MKKIIILLSIFGLIQFATAQKKKVVRAKPKTAVATNKVSTKKAEPVVKKVSNSFKTGDLLLNAGIGIVSLGIPVHAGADYFVTDDISVGADVSYQRYDENFFADSYKSTIIGIGAIGNYHFGRILKSKSEWDFYGGIGIGYIIWTFDNNNYLGSNVSGISYGGQIGARYFFSRKFAANVELGGVSTLSGIKIGVSYKI